MKKIFEIHNTIFFKSFLMNFMILIFIAFFSSFFCFKFFEKIVFEEKYNKIYETMEKINPRIDEEKINNNYLKEILLKEKICDEVYINVFFGKDTIYSNSDIFYIFKKEKNNGKIFKEKLNNKEYIILNIKINNNLNLQYFTNIDKQIEYLCRYRRNMIRVWFLILIIHVLYSFTGGYFYYKKSNKIFDEIKKIDLNNIEEKIDSNNYNYDMKKMTSVINNLLMELKRIKNDQKKFISLVSHEVRTPIAIIQGYIEIIEDWGCEDKKVFKESVNAIKQEIIELGSLIEKIIFIARQENKMLKITFEDVNIEEICKNIFEKLKSIDNRHNYIYKNELKNKEYVIGDKKLIEQLITVIIENSIKYTDENKEITGKIYSDSINIIIELNDNGNGIPKDKISKVFEKYYGIDNEKSIKTKGLGLGLTTAKMICDLHGGKIDIKSEEDKGTFVTIILPKKLEV